MKLPNSKGHYYCLVLWYTPLKFNLEPNKCGLEPYFFCMVFAMEHPVGTTKWHSRLGIRPEQYDHPHIWDFNQWLVSSQDAQTLDFLWIFLGQMSRGQIITTKLCQTRFNIQCASMFSSRIPILVKPLKWLLNSFALWSSHLHSSNPVFHGQIQPRLFWKNIPRQVDVTWQLDPPDSFRGHSLSSESKWSKRLAHSKIHASMLGIARNPWIHERKLYRKPWCFSRNDGGFLIFFPCHHPNLGYLIGWVVPMNTCLKWNLRSFWESYPCNYHHF